MKRFLLTVCATLLAGFAFGVTFAPKEYVDRAISDSFSTSNNALVSTIHTVAPQEGNYSAVSNYAMRSVQPNTGVHFTGLSIGPYPSVFGGSTTLIEKDRVCVGTASVGSEYGGTSITYYDLFGTYTISFPKKTGTAVVDSDISANSAVFVSNVCGIVTNEVFGEWKLPATFYHNELAPNLEWIEEHGDTSKGYYYFSYIRYNGNGEWWADYQERGWSEESGWDGDGWGVYGYGAENATSVTFTIDGFPSGQDQITVTRKVGNALGFVRENDLPHKTPVDELLLNGADGKVYHLRIGAGGSIDVYTEVAQ